jgi:hypothetical protein
MDFWGSITVPEMVPVDVCAAAALVVSAAATSRAPKTLQLVVLDLDNMNPPSTDAGADPDQGFASVSEMRGPYLRVTGSPEEFSSAWCISQDQIATFRRSPRIRHDFDDANVRAT